LGFDFKDKQFYDGGPKLLFLRFLTSFGMTLLTLFYDWKRFGATKSRRIFSSNVYMKKIFIPNTV